jgi:hypothetical protein
MNKNQNTHSFKIASFKSIKVNKGEKIILHFPDLEDYEALLAIKEKASKVFGKNNVLVIMGNVSVSKISNTRS